VVLRPGSGARDLSTAPCYLLSNLPGGAAATGYWQQRQRRRQRRAAGGGVACRTPRTPRAPRYCLVLLLGALTTGIGIGYWLLEFLAAGSWQLAAQSPEPEPRARITAACYLLLFRVVLGVRSQTADSPNANRAGPQLQSQARALRRAVIWGAWVYRL
jgi:hypothetical protein